MKYLNPFEPTAGAEPPRIIGRDAAVMTFVQGLEEGVGSPGRLMRISGPRGSGKTVLLNDLGENAREHGWFVIDVTAGPDMLDDLQYALSSRVEAESGSVGIGVGVMSAELTVKKRDLSLRDRMCAACGRASGLLITVDEVQDASTDDMRRIAQSVQHLIREKQNIALAFAGLPMGVMDLINGKALTFLRRAISEELSPINAVEVALSLRDSFAQTGLTLGDEQQVRAAKATEGYAYMIQLVGYYVWQRADMHRNTSIDVTSRDVEEGIAVARAQYEQLVLEAALAGIGKGAMEYVIAMAEDPKISSTARVAARLGKTSKVAGAYRHQLIQRQVIQPVSRGYVEFAVPLMRDYVMRNKEELMLRYGG